MTFVDQTFVETNIDPWNTWAVDLHFFSEKKAVQARHRVVFGAQQAEKCERSQQLKFSKFFFPFSFSRFENCQVMDAGDGTYQCRQGGSWKMIHGGRLIQSSSSSALEAIRDGWFTASSSIIVLSSCSLCFPRPDSECKGGASLKAAAAAEKLSTALEKFHVGKTEATK